MGKARGPNDLKERRGIAYLQYVLGKAHDDIGEYDTAFKYISAANKRVRTIVEYKHDVTKTRVQSLKTMFNPEAWGITWTHALSGMQVCRYSGMQV